MDDAITAIKNHRIVLAVILLGSFLFHSLPYFILDSTKYNFYDADTWYFIVRFPQFFHNTPLQTFNTFGFFPPILSLVFAIIVYYLVSKIFSEQTGFYSAILLSIGTGGLFQSSLFGFIDHHLIQAVLLTILILCIILLIKNKSIFYLIPITISIILIYPASQDLWVMYYGFAGLTVIILILEYLWGKNKEIAIFLVVFSGAFGYFYFTEYLSARWTQLWNWTEPIMEIQPTNPISLVLWFNVIIIPLSIGIYHFIRPKEKRTIQELILIIMAGLLFILTLKFVRMEYMFAPFITILAAYYLDKYYKPKIAHVTITLFLLLSVLLGIGMIVNITELVHHNDGWNGALEFLGQQEQGTVLAWWDWGYFIEAGSGQKTFVNPAQIKAKEAADIFTSNNQTAFSLVQKYSIKYIAVMSDDERFYDPSMLYYSHLNLTYNESFLKELVDGNLYKDQIIYENPTIKIYKVINSTQTI